MNILLLGKPLVNIYVNKAILEWIIFLSAKVPDNSFHVVAATDSAALVPSLQYKCRVCYKE